MELLKKKALITGIGSEISQEIAKQLHKEGVEVFAQYRKNLPENTGIPIKNFLQKELFTPKDSKELLTEFFEKTNGELHILINSIGDFLIKPLNKLQPEEFRNIINSNLNLTFDLCHFALPNMRKMQGSSILNIGYILNHNKLKPKSNILPYQIGKLGLVLLTKALAKEEWENKVSVNCLSVGICENSKHSLAKNNTITNVTKIQEISDSALFLIKSSYLSGTDLHLSGGWFL